MATAKLKTLANEIIEDAKEWPAEALYEVLEELIRVTAEDEELNESEARRLFELVSARI